MMAGMPLSDLAQALRETMPLAMHSITLGERRTGLVVVDEVNGFATVGAGNLAPPVENPQVSSMVAETDRLARAFSEHGWPVFAFLDSHEPGKPEPPYPPHCERGTGEDELVPALAWFHEDANVTLVRKDCINGFVGATRPDGGNALVDWVNASGLEEMVVVGICTDICVMDFVLSALSARNHDMMPGLRDITVYERGCSTFDLPRSVAEELGYGATASHPQDVTHYMGLYFMASRGARIAGELKLGG